MGDRVHQPHHRHSTLRPLLPSNRRPTEVPISENMNETGERSPLPPKGMVDRAGIDCLPLGFVALFDMPRLSSEGKGTKPRHDPRCEADPHPIFPTHHPRTVIG